MAQVSVFSPWKDCSRMVGAADQSVAFYVKCIADLGPAGGQADQATIAVATGVDTITIQIAEGGGALANDAGITYTGQSGGVGTLTTTDGNANTIGEVINIINGIGAGQAQIRRYRAALADVPPGLGLVATDLLARVAANILLGRYHIGLPIFIDTSTAGLITADDKWIGIGTQQGTIEGSGWLMPDYFEDIPGSSTTASVNTPIRQGIITRRKAEDATTRHKQYRITGFASAGFHATTQLFEVRDIANNVLHTEPLVANALVAFQDRSDTPIEGPVGSPLFCRFYGTGGLTDGAFLVAAEERSV